MKFRSSIDGYWVVTRVEYILSQDEFITRVNIEVKVYL